METKEKLDLNFISNISKVKPSRGYIKDVIYFILLSHFHQHKWNPSEHSWVDITKQTAEKGYIQGRLQ